MKILQIFRQFSPTTGGVESVMQGLSVALLQKGYTCDVVTLNRIFTSGEKLPPTDSVDGIPVYRLPYFGSNRYPIAPSVLSFISSYDLIHIHAIDFFVDFLALTSLWHQKPLVVNTHGGFFHTKWFLPFKKLYFQTITRQILNAVDATICDSQHDHKLFRTIVSPKRLHIIENGVDVRPFVAIEKHIQHGLIVGIGRMVENKGIEQLIKLLPHIVSDYPHVQLVWIGNDAHQRIPHFLQLAKQYGVAQHVHFTGNISQQEMLEWLAKAHFFVSASSYEAFGVSTIEAMCSATVPIVTPVGIHPHVVQEHKNGFVFTWDHIEKAASLFRYALSLDMIQIAQMGALARAVSLRYSWDNVIDSYLAIYHSVLEK